MMPLVAQTTITLADMIQEPIFWALVLGTIALILVVPRSQPGMRAAGGLLAAVAGGFFMAAGLRATGSRPGEALIEWSVFSLLAVTAVGAGIAMISSRSAVYSAIWFALSLLAVGGLFLFQGAQFLGVATVTVYAGAIVVTFLFVIMLAQPEGHAVYDRLTWGWFAKPAAAIAASLLIGAVVYALDGVAVGGLRETVAAALDEHAASADEPPALRGSQVARAELDEQEGATILKLTPTSDAAAAELSPAAADAIAQRVLERLQSAANDDEAARVPESLSVQLTPALDGGDDVLGEHHMAHLGAYLFSRHLVALEVAGTLLLVAMVGAVTMLSQGSNAARRERNNDV